MQPAGTERGANTTGNVGRTSVTVPGLAARPRRAFSRTWRLRSHPVLRFSFYIWDGFRFRWEIALGCWEQLEDSVSDPDSAIFSNGQKADPRSKENWAVRKRPSGISWDRRAEGRRGKELKMPLLDIQPERYRKILYENPRRGKKVNIEVEANADLDIFIVPESALESWRRGSRDYEGDGFMRRKHLQVQLNFEGRQSDRHWYLILDNKSDHVISASYRVYEE